MVQGTSTRQKANENVAPRYEARENLYRISSLLFLNSTPLGRTRIATTNVSPIAAANSPLSGRNRTDTPARIPVATHSHKAFFWLLALNASVAVKHIASAKKMVGVSVRIV